MEGRSRYDHHKEDRYIRPSKAEALLKAAHYNHQTVYIYGSTGYGKTSLVCEVLSRRKYEYHSLKDEDFFIDELLKSAGTSKERIIVIDDLHLLMDAKIRERFSEGLKRLTEDLRIWLILIARCPIPPWLKQIYIDQTFMIIDENLLSFTDSEAENYLECWDMKILPETQKKILETCKGYPLALRIMAMRILSLGRSVTPTLKMELQEIEKGRIDLFDYLEQYVYDRWPLSLQEFLMDVSIVEVFDQELAHFITRKNDVNRLILLAQESGNILKDYILNDKIYFKLRPLLKASMQRWMKKRYTRDRIKELYYSAGTYYEIHGHVLNALEMYEQCGNEESISRLLIENAKQYVGAGHYWNLRYYYFKLSEERILQNPELIAGMSMLHSIMLNDEESERWYGYLKQFKERHTGNSRKVAQERLLYLDIALPHRGIFKMSVLLKQVWQLHSSWKIVLPEISLTNNQPSVMHGGKDFCEWSKRDQELADSIGTIIEKVLGKFGRGLVSIALAESFFEKGSDDYKVSELANKGRLQAESGGKVELAFVAVGLLVQQALLDGRIEDALDSLESFKAKAESEAEWILSGIETLRTRILLYIGKRDEIEQWMHQAPDENTEFCTLERYRYITKVRVYLAMGKREKALNLLQLLLPFAEKRQRTFLYLEAKMLLAITQYRLDNPNWRETLQETLTKVSDYHFVRLLTREGKALWELLKSVDLVWSDEDFQKQVLSECRQMAELYPSYLNEKQTGRIILSHKALKVLRMQAEGMSVEEIAAAMGLSKAGVKYYNQENYKKLGVNNKAAAVTEAKNRGIL